MARTAELVGHDLWFSALGKCRGPAARKSLCRKWRVWTYPEKEEGLLHFACTIETSLASRQRQGLEHWYVIHWEGAAIEDIKTALNSAARRVYLQNLTPHTLKHTAATWLMQSGKDPFKISDFLATSVPTLLKHYGHHNPEHQHEIADAICARPRMQQKLGS